MPYENHMPYEIVCPMKCPLSCIVFGLGINLSLSAYPLNEYLREAYICVTKISQA